MPKKNVKTPMEKIQVGVSVPVKWHIPDDIITRFASNMVVQMIENEFKVSFFELQPEITLDPSKKLEVMPAKCVASVIITADRLQKFIDVLQTQMDLYKSRNTPIA
jgi:hypothetical protein